MTSTHWCILKGSNSVHYLTHPKTRIGRDTSHNDVLLLSQSISKRQCLIDGSDPGNVTLTDHNSRNGTFINGQLCQNATVKLNHGDIIRFGFDANCYRVEMASYPPITSPPPPPEQHRFDDTRRYNRSHSAPSKLRGSQPQRESVTVTRTNPSYLRGENRAAGFMIGSPPTSPLGRGKYGDTASTVMMGDEQRHELDNGMKHKIDSVHDIASDHNSRSNTSHSRGPSQSKESQSVSKCSSSKKDNQEMQILKDAMFRLETKLNTMTSLSEETKYPVVSQQIRSGHSGAATLTLNNPEVSDTANPGRTVNESKISFSDSMAICKISKSLQMLNMKIQYLVHLFKSMHDFNANIPEFIEFNVSKVAQTDTPTLSDSMKLLQYLNDILDATQCTEIGEFIKNSQSEILLHRNQTNRNRNRCQDHSVQVDDEERDKLIAVGHSMKEYANTLQIRLYQIRQILMSKDEVIAKLSEQDWVHKLESFQNSNASLKRQIVIQQKEVKRLYKMLSELTEFREFRCSAALKSKINEFITSYSKKIFHLTSQLSEAQRRKQEKNRKWTELHDKTRRLQSKVQCLNGVLSSQRESFKKTLQEKDLALIKVNRELSVLAGLNGTNDQEKAAKFLFETLQKYIDENDRCKFEKESLETALQLKVQEVQELQESYQLKLDELRKGDNVERLQLQEELREEREHYGAERIAKLEAMCFELQTNLAQRDEKIEKLVDENRKLSETAPLDEVETIEFLSKSNHQKEEQINTLKSTIKRQTIKIRELEMIETSQSTKIQKHRLQIQDIQQKHKKLNSILSHSTSSGLAARTPINQMPSTMTIDEDGPLMSSFEPQNLEIDLVDHDIDVAESAE